MSTTPDAPAGTYRLTSLSKLRLEHPNWQNPRTFTDLDAKSLKDLGADFKERGIRDPLEIMRVYDGENGKRHIVELVFDGQRRVKAAELIYDQDEEVIPVIDRTPEDVDAIDLEPAVADQILLDMLAVGTFRAGLSSYELSEVAQRMRARGNTMDKIAQAIDRSESWVSKMLKARGKADAKLLASWKKGDVTDEQFKDLAMVEIAEQKEALDDVLDTKRSGDKAEARVKAKEKAASAKAKEPKMVAKPKKPSKAERKASEKAAKSEHKQPDLFAAKKTEAQVMRERAVKTPPRVILEEFVAIGDKKPPTHDYVVGLMDGVRHALGLLDVTEMKKPWQTYIARVGGVSVGEQRKKAKAAKKAKKAKPKKFAANGKRGKRGAAPKRKRTMAKAKKSGKSGKSGKSKSKE